MKKILQIVDIYGWAIGSLSKAIMKYNPHFDWRTLEIHPKDLEQGKVDLKKIEEAIRAADIIDCQYWRTLSQLLELLPVLKEKPIILTHHNEKNLLSYEWPENVIHVAKTKYSEDKLREKYPTGQIIYIPNSFDHTEFNYISEYPPKEKAVGYVGRIVPWKGLKDICRACFELGYPLMIMGKHDKPSYFAEIPPEHQAVIDWSFLNCSDAERKEYYKNITIYVGNSGSGREVGTLGFIEALASGVPVVTTAAGLAADIGRDNENMLMVDYDDYDGLKEKIQQLMEYPEIQNRLRRAGWESIRNYNDERMAIEYRKLLNEIVYKQDLVSVIIPTTPDKAEQTHQILEALEKQTYTDWEAIVVFDQALDPDEIMSTFREAVKSRYSHVVKVACTNEYGGYNLAKARNIGLLDADGKYVMLNDNRLLPEYDAIKQLLNAILQREKDAKVWVFGEKGGEKKTFVENFSMILRKHLINSGMFCERITGYGGMSQELRERFSHQGFEFGYVPTALAEQIVKSSLSPAKRSELIRMKNILYKLGQY